MPDNNVYSFPAENPSETINIDEMNTQVDPIAEEENRGIGYNILFT